MMAGGLAGEVAIVTGAGINTGAVIARTLADDGAAVVVNYRRAESGAHATVAEIAAAGGKAIAVEGDVTKPADVTRLVTRAVEAFGTVSILVNNANVRSYRELMDISHEEWRSTLATTLDGSFFCIQAVVPLMRKLGHGTIVSIGGSTAHSGRPRRAHVAAAKAGLAGLTGALASELAGDNITVNCVVPGRIDTGRPDTPVADRGSRSRVYPTSTTSLSDQVGQARLGAHRSPTGRSASQQEIANLVRFLCSSECRFITGAMLHVNGASYVTIA